MSGPLPWLMAGVLAAVGPCGGVPRVTDLDDAARFARGAGVLEKKRQQCAKLAELQIALEEEKGLGGAVALNWVRTGGGLALDYDQGKEVAALKDWKKVSVDKTPANELTRYLNRVGRNLAAQSDRLRHSRLPLGEALRRRQAARTHER